MLISCSGELVKLVRCNFLNICVLVLVLVVCGLFSMCRLNEGCSDGVDVVCVMVVVVSV